MQTRKISFLTLYFFYCVIRIFYLLRSNLEKYFSDIIVLYGLIRFFYHFLHWGLDKEYKSIHMDLISFIRTSTYQIYIQLILVFIIFTTRSFILSIFFNIVNLFLIYILIIIHVG